MKIKKMTISAALLAGLLQACSVLAPADDVTGTSPQLERYSVASLDTLVVDGKTTLQELTAIFGPGQQVAQPHSCAAGVSGATGKGGDKRECQIYVWTFNRINYANRQLKNRNLSASVVISTKVVDRHKGGGYDKPY